ncbi:RluA family pseudouridine synthase [Marinicella sp. S1101]|uniref:RluA family pseudouridine synthase n=2 Tax=Marinicella marina TaxID=2996016 RepID=UPI002260D7D9|nr:RluA family pseudouridine synthase [Marinicella marina]MCX7553852.1 RluA family pseudouridine synthase [Marinicella marina]MDJ1140928.1 RluA family pseudouridine synthase [Marinicella marina]
MMPNIPDKKPIFTVTQNDAGQRVDNYLLKQRKQLAKSTCYKLMRKGQIRVNGKRIKPTLKLQCGDQIRVPPFVFYVDKEPVNVSEQEQHMVLQTKIFEDEDYLVLDKPAGTPVHKGSGHDFGIIEVINSISGYEAVQLAHRLDKDTSGCLLLSKNRAALLRFQQGLIDGVVEKTYLAVLTGAVEQPVEVNASLDVDYRVNGFRHVIVSQSGKSAQTRFKPLKHFRQYTLVECEISQGRTHQIRVHAKHIGHPVVGDEFYGKKQADLSRKLYLHAHQLNFNGMTWLAPVPAEFKLLQSSM